VSYTNDNRNKHTYSGIRVDKIQIPSYVCAALVNIR